MTAEILVLRLVHVLGGIFWVGSGLFTAFFLIPVLGKAGGAAAGQIMAALQQRRLFIVLPTVAVLTILSGLRLMQIASGGFGPGYFATASGRTYAISGLAAIIAFVSSLLVSRPNAVRTGQVAAALAAASDDSTRAALTSELATLRRRGSISGIVVVILLLVAAAGMAVGRYV
jgi:uncharacterized membrane protein